MHVYILYGLVLAITIGDVRCEEWYEVGNPHFLDTGTVFPAIKEADTFKVIKFFSPWCKYCRYVKSYMETFKSSNEVSSNLKFFDFNCQSNGPMFCWEHFQVRAYPAVIIFDQNGNQATRFEGLYPQQTINNILRQFNNKAKAIIAAKVEQTKTEEPKKLGGEVKEPQKTEQTPPPPQPQPQKKQQPKNVQPQTAETAKKEQTKDPEQSPTESKQNQKPKSQANTQIQPQPAKIKVQEPQKLKQQETGLKPEITSSSEQAKPEARNMQSGQKDQKAKPSQKENIKITNQMVDEASVEAAIKPNPSKPELEKDTIATKPEQSSPSFFKYLLYLIGASVGALYAIKIFTTRLEGPASKPSQSTGNSSNASKSPKITSRDIEHQILAEEIADQHL